MSNVYNYDPAKHTLIIGTTRIADYAEDTKITIAYKEDFRSETMGVDGDATLNEHHNRNATVTIRILQSSPLNATLTTLAKKGGTLPLAHVDRNFTGDIGAYASKAFFTKIPDKSIGKASKEREWVLTAINLKESTIL